MLGKNRKEKGDSKIFLPTITNPDFLGKFCQSMFYMYFLQNKTHISDYQRQNNEP